jgi:hypothetical protein
MYIYREIMNTDYLLSVNDFYMQFSQNALLWFHILYIFLHKNTIYCTFSYVPNQHYQIFMVQMDLVGTILRYL